MRKLTRRSQDLVVSQELLLVETVAALTKPRIEVSSSSRPSHSKPVGRGKGGSVGINDEKETQDHK